MSCGANRLMSHNGPMDAWRTVLVVSADAWAS